MTDGLDDAIELPWQEPLPEGDEVAAWDAQRRKVAAALIEFDGCPPLDLDVVGP